MLHIKKIENKIEVLKDGSLLGYVKPCKKGGYSLTVCENGAMGKIKGIKKPFTKDEALNKLLTYLT